MRLLSVMIALRRVHALFVGGAMHAVLNWAVSLDAVRVIVKEKYVQNVFSVEAEK